MSGNSFKLEGFGSIMNFIHSSGQEEVLRNNCIVVAKQVSDPHNNNLRIS